MRAGLGPILMVFCIAMFLGVVMAVPGLATMMLGISMSLGFGMAGMFVLLTGLIRWAGAKNPTASGDSCCQDNGDGDALFSRKIKGVLVDIDFHNELLRTAWYG